MIALLKKYRWHLGAMSPSAKRVNHLTRCVRDAFAENWKDRKVQLKVDLDPYGAY